MNQVKVIEYDFLNIALSVQEKTKKKHDQTLFVLLWLKKLYWVVLLILLIVSKCKCFKWDAIINQLQKQKYTFYGWTKSAENWQIE